MNRLVESKSSNESGQYQPSVNRILGLYPQKQDGLFMQRIKIPGGRINWRQWRRVAHLADLYCRGFPLHITTRQDIELHNVTFEDIPAVQQGLAEAALTVFGAGGDAVRNITVCTGCDLHNNGYDLFPIAQLVRCYLDEQSVILNLPRKFKISFSGCKNACAKPWLNDLGFIAQDDGILKVVGAGSLGPRPALGIELYREVQGKDILPLCMAAVKLFEQYGDRENRHQARFRHMREKLGDATFREQLDARFVQLKEKKVWPDITPAKSINKNNKILYRLQLPNGNIEPSQAIELADTAEQAEAVLRINLEHSLELYSEKSFKLPDSFIKLTKNPAVIACPGSAVCQKALADCWATADSIRKMLSTSDFPDAHIHISGCPNNCGKSAVADIGLIGMIRRENGRQVPYYRILIGGGNGKNNALARECCIVGAADVPNMIMSVLMERRYHIDY